MKAALRSWILLFVAEALANISLKVCASYEVLKMTITTPIVVYTHTLRQRWSTLMAFPEEFLPFIFAFLFGPPG